MKNVISLKVRILGSNPFLTREYLINQHIGVRTIGGQIKLEHLKFNLCKSNH
jgi:hypothetical protein